MLCYTTSKYFNCAYCLIFFSFNFKWYVHRYNGKNYPSGKQQIKITIQFNNYVMFFYPSLALQDREAC